MDNQNYLIKLVDEHNNVSLIMLIWMKLEGNNFTRCKNDLTIMLKMKIWLKIMEKNTTKLSHNQSKFQIPHNKNTLFSSLFSTNE